jgi:hypothetical protein
MATVASPDFKSQISYGMTISPAAGHRYDLSPTAARACLSDFVYEEGS